MFPLELHIAALSESKSVPGRYALILKEDGGSKMTILIGRYEARAIAMVLEGVKPPQPQTHDSWLASLEKMGVQLKEVVIDDFKEGIFKARLIGKGPEGDRFEQLCRPSDGIALAIRASCPIHTSPEILEIANAFSEGKSTAQQKIWEGLSLEELGEMLTRALEEEDYDRASQIQNVINRKRK